MDLEENIRLKEFRQLRKKTQIHHQIFISLITTIGFGIILGTIKVLEVCKLSLRNPACGGRRS
ncbi:hypothetical protein ACFL7M_17035 [Thermodesulfobacteriota bacterium]